MLTKNVDPNDILPLQVRIVQFYNGRVEALCEGHAMQHFGAYLLR